MLPIPFFITNQYYNYKYLQTDAHFPPGYYIILCIEGELAIRGDNDALNISTLQYIEFTSDADVILLTNSPCVVLSRPTTTPSRISTFKLISCGSVLTDSYLVSKPWGFERWLSGAVPSNNLVLKYIYIKQGYRTSLQYHEKKHESNFLLKGTAKLTLATEQYIPGSQYELHETVLDSGHVFDVTPMTIHQLEALTDILLIESSTNDLDDVIRLSDDAGRHDGRVESEHNLK